MSNFVLWLPAYCTFVFPPTVLGVSTVGAALPSTLRLVPIVLLVTVVPPPFCSTLALVLTVLATMLTPSWLVVQPTPADATLSYPAEELASGCATERLTGEDQRDLLARFREPGELRSRLSHRAEADDAIAPLVAIAQFALNVVERFPVFVNGENDGTEHAPNRNLSGSGGAELRWTGYFGVSEPRLGQKCWMWSPLPSYPH
jgi:hypothetical protein